MSTQSKIKAGLISALTLTLIGGALALEQYTGTKNINNKKIYEGDIVMLVFLDGYGEQEDSDEISYVAWNNADSRFEMYGHSGLLTTNALEVIGNIHENPKLLEEK